MAQDAALACRRELGAELRKRREAAGLTGLELAHQVGWSPSRVSRVESGHLGLSEVDLIHYLAFCGVYPRDHGDLLAMCRQTERKLGYWLSPHGQWLEDSVRSLIFQEATATGSISYEPHVLPGLVQTEDYARAMVRRYGSRTERNVEFCVRARMDRQGILHRFDPARFDFFIHEHALRLMVGDPATMHEQLLLLVLLDGLPHVMVRVVPASASFGGGFRLFRYAQHAPLVYVSSQVAGMFLEDQEYVAEYRELVGAIADIALTERQSREFVAALATEYDRGSAHTHVEEKQL